MSKVYLNGEIIPKEKALVPVDDRGFLFADGIYEVTPAFRGSFFRLELHTERMRRGLEALRIDFDPATLADVHPALLAANGFEASPTCYVYVQVTRGVAPRAHAFPNPPVRPTVYAFAREFARPAREVWEKGFAAITVPDRRWARVDIKSIALLPNCLAMQAAIDAGAQDAILVKDGVALEGAHANFFSVLDGVVTTHPATNHILHGITRGYMLELCRELRLPLEERPIQVEELARADEAFFTGTTTEVKPVVRIDGRPVGEGRVGPVARRLQEAYVAATGRLAGSRAAAGAGAR
jgi:D-alanine transaminase